MGARHGFLTILISFVFAGLWPVTGRAQEDPKKEEKPATEKPVKPQGESEPQESEGKQDEKPTDEEEPKEPEAPPEPPKKAFHPSGLPKPPGFFEPKKGEEAKPEKPRYRSGLAKPPALRGDQGEDGEVKEAAKAEPAPKPVEEENLSIAERIRRLTERRRPLMAGPVEPTVRRDGTPTKDDQRPELSELVRHVRVQILLRNGQTFEGIVKDQQVIRDLKDGRLVLGPRSGLAGRGFRLWYVYETEGYVRIGYNQIREMKALRTLTPNEVQAIHDRLAEQRQTTLADEMERRRVRDERFARREAERAAADEAKKNQEAEGGVAADSVRNERYQELLAQFSPEDGWTPERKDEIERRKITVDVFPTKVEQAFLDSFEEWLPAYHFWVEEQKKGEEEEAGKNEKADGTPDGKGAKPVTPPAKGPEKPDKPKDDDGGQ